MISPGQRVSPGERDWKPANPGVYTGVEPRLVRIPDAAFHFKGAMFSSLTPGKPEKSFPAKPNNFIGNARKRGFCMSRLKML